MNRKSIKNKVLKWMDENAEFYEGRLEELVEKALDMCLDLRNSSPPIRTQSQSDCPKEDLI